MLFRHKHTEKPALWITPYNANWNNQNDPNLFRIRSFKDLPEPQSYYSLLGIAPEIWKLQGKFGLYCYFIEFIKEIDPKSINDFWFFLLSDGFPDGVIP